MSRDGQLGGHHRRILDEVFTHPASTNLHWQDAVGLVGVLGTVEERHDGKLLFTVGTRRETCDRPHGKALTAPELRRLRAFLAAAGVQPGNAQPTAPTDDGPTIRDVVVVVAHHDTRLFALAGDGAATTLRPHEPHQFLHHLAHRREAHHRGQRAPEDEGYYDRIVAALATARRILVVSHGTGEADAGAILAARLAAGHGDTHARVVRLAHADTSALTDAQLIALATAALGPAS